MCLAVPGKVVEIAGEGLVRMGRVDFCGVQRQACLAYVPEVAVGDYVLVHVGFAISRIDEQAALETLQVLAAIGGLAEIEGPDTFAAASSRGGPDAPR
jgi:hydrogenase expression/formation protein HypC